MALNCHFLNNFKNNKNNFFADKMDSMDWRDELHKLLATIKPQATATLLTIKEKFELQFNANFKQQCASIFNEW